MLYAGLQTGEKVISISNPVLLDMPKSLSPDANKSKHESLKKEKLERFATMVNRILSLASRYQEKTPPTIEEKNVFYVHRYRCPSRC